MVVLRRALWCSSTGNCHGTEAVGVALGRCCVEQHRDKAVKSREKRGLERPEGREARAAKAARGSRPGPEETQCVSAPRAQQRTPLPRLFINNAGSLPRPRRPTWVRSGARGHAPRRLARALAAGETSSAIISRARPEAFCARRWKPFLRFFFIEDNGAWARKRGARAPIGKRLDEKTRKPR